MDRTLIVNYDEGAPNEVFQAIAQVVGDETYVLLVYGELSGLQRRNAQLQVVATGFTITAVEATDLAAWTLPVAQAGRAGRIRRRALNATAPGVAIAVVQDGEVAYLQGFWLHGGEPITPSTQMMIGSIGKTHFHADSEPGGRRHGRLGHAVVDVAVSRRRRDPDAEITFRNLLCARTGVPRRDLELASTAAVERRRHHRVAGHVRVLHRLR